MTVKGMDDMSRIYDAVANWLFLPRCNDHTGSVNETTTTYGGVIGMAGRGLPTQALAQRNSTSSLNRLAASGIYQFRGSAGEKVTVINKEKLRSATAGISSKTRK